MEYKCHKCGMGVKNLTCTKCNSELVSDVIKTEKGMFKSRNVLMDVAKLNHQLVVAMIW